MPFKDWVWETTAGAPSRWNAVSGTWTVQANTIEIDDDGLIDASGTACAPAEQTVQKGTIPQAGEMWFDVTMNDVSEKAGGTPVMFFIFFASANAGAYLTNSYVLELSTAGLNFYRSDANVLTLLSTYANVHTINTEYDIIIHRTAAGVWTFYEGGSIINDFTATDTTYTTGSYLGLRGDDLKGHWSEIRARYGYCDVTYFSTRNIMTKEVSTLKFGFVPTDSTDEAENWSVGDGVEALLYDGTNIFVEFWGKVETIEDDDAGETHVVAYDWRVELLKAEVNFNANKKLSDTMTDVVAAAARVLTTAGIKATGEAAVSRTMNGEYSYVALKKLAQEAGYFITYDGSGLMNVTDTTSASGLTIVDDDVARFKKVLDLTANVNTVRTYYSGGNNQTGGSGTDYNTYGRSDRLLVDLAIPDATKATARANYLINRYGGSVQVIDVWVINSAHAQLKPGDTATLTSSWIGVTAATCFVMEKEYSTESADGIRYRVTVEGSATERHLKGHKEVLVGMMENAQYGLGMQV